MTLSAVMTSRVKSSWTILCRRLIMHRLHPSHSPPTNRKWPQAAEEATATEDRPAAATNVNGSGRQTNSSFSKFPSFLPIRSPMGGLPRISVGVGTKSGSWAAAERGGQSRHWRARSSGGRVTTEMYFCNFVATQGCIKEINKVS